MNNAKIKAYVTNLGKYNEGQLVGKWVDLPIEEDDFEKVLKEIGIDGEEYEEYFFTDYEYENIENLNFGEYKNIDELNEITEQIENLSDYELVVFNAIVQAFGAKYALDIDLESELDNYYLYNDIHSNEDLGRYYIEECGRYDLDKLGDLINYIDYDAFGRDIAINADGDFTDYGFIETV